MGFLCGWLRRQWLLSKNSLPRRVALFFAIYLAAAVLLSIRVPVIVTGVAFEEGGARAYSNETNDYAYSMMTRKKVNRAVDPFAAIATSAPVDPAQPPLPKGYSFANNPASQLPSTTRSQSTSQIDPHTEERVAQTTIPADDPWSVIGSVPEEAPPTLNVDRYTSRLEILFAVLGALWFGVIPYFPQLKQCAALLPLLVYAIAAIGRLLYVPCVWVMRRAFERMPERNATGSLWVWQVDGQSIRYGMVLYEELVLLAIVAGCYGAAFAVIRHLHPRQVSV